MAQKIRDLPTKITTLLRKRPHWGAHTLAEEIGTTAHSVRVVASREGIALMDRREVEAWIDERMDREERDRGAS